MFIHSFKFQLIHIEVYYKGKWGKGGVKLASTRGLDDLRIFY